MVFIDFEVESSLPKFLVHVVFVSMKLPQSTKWYTLSPLFIASLNFREVLICASFNCVRFNN